MKIEPKISASTSFKAGFGYRFGEGLAALALTGTIIVLAFALLMLMAFINGQAAR